MARPKPLLQTFCYCLPLRTGALTAGILAIILSILTIVVILLVRLDLNTLFLNWLSLTVKKIILIINLIMTIIITTLMMIGVIKRNHYCMLPWVLLGIIIVIGVFISITWNGILYFIDGLVLEGVIFLIVGYVICVIYAYMWAVVYSYFAILREEEYRGRYSKQPYRR